jgi:lipoprotein-anchoring transpeptidase ErfK/SrfK
VTDSEFLITQKLVEQAVLALKTGDKDRAFDYAKQAAEHTPQLEEPWLIMAAASNPESSLQYLKRALDINPGSQRAREGIRWALQQKRDGKKGKPATIRSSIDARHQIDNRAQDSESEPRSRFEQLQRDWDLKDRLDPLKQPDLQQTDLDQTGFDHTHPGMKPAEPGVDQTQPVLQTRPSNSPSQTQPVKTAKPSKKRSGKQNKWIRVPVVFTIVFFFIAIGYFKGCQFELPVNLFNDENRIAHAALQKPSLTPSNTPTPTPTSTPTPTPTPTNTPTATPTSTPTPTPTATPYPTATPFIISINNPPASGVRWIDVDLSEQRLSAYDGPNLQDSFIISSGTWQHPTLTGQYQIYLRYEFADMSGPGYYLPDVPYTMYYYGSYGIHGTYWHNNFGTPMSHGCINMRTEDAKWLYNWSSIGTYVVIHN